MVHNYTVTLKPYGDDPTRGVVLIDPVSRAGYWEHRDGSEGGGLWFAPVPGRDYLELLDYDGAFDLPEAVIQSLVDSGFAVNLDGA